MGVRSDGVSVNRAGARAVEQSGGGAVGKLANRQVRQAGQAPLNGAAGAGSQSLGTVPVGVRQVKLNQSDLAVLGNKLVNGLESGAISRGWQQDFGDAVMTIQQIDKDLVEASKLLEGSNDQPLTEVQENRAQALLSAAKYNLVQLRNWSDAAQEQMQDRPEEVKFTTGLQDCIAERSMDVADLMSLYDLDQAPTEQGVSRADRINFNLVDAKAARVLAQSLNVEGLPEDARASLQNALQQHEARLQDALDLAQGKASNEPQLNKLPTEAWENSFDLHKNKTQSEDVKALRSQWKASLASGQQAQMPLTHPRLSQEKMLEEFVGFHLETANVDKAHMPDFKFAFSNAKNEVLNAQDWQPVEKELHYNPKLLPKIGKFSARASGNTPSAPSAAAPPTHKALSTITPAPAMAAHFADDYAGKGVNCSDRLQYKHVPNLALTELKNSDGKQIVTALRHGILDSYDINASALRKLPQEQLATMVADLLVPDGPDKEQQVTSIVNDIRTSSSQAKQHADRLRTAASRNMAEELAVASLASDPGKLQRALDGDTVELNLNSISLVTPDKVRPLLKPKGNERDMLRRQTEALQSLQGDKMQLKVRDSEGQLRTVNAKIKVRTFNFGVNGGAVGKMYGVPSHLPVWRNTTGGWNYSMEQNNPALTEMFGPLQTPSGNPAQDLTEREFPDDLRYLSRLEPLRREDWGLVGEKLQSLEQQYVDKQRSLRFATGSDHEATLAELEDLRGKHKALIRAATDAKQIWRDGSYVKGGDDPYKMVSRLGLVINLMDGESLAFNCKSGKDRTGQLDAELKYQAALADAGSELSPGKTPPELRKMHSDFTLQAGNLEMQRLNTGVPGFKLKLNETPGLRNYIASPSLSSAYRGGSAYVKG